METIAKSLASIIDRPERYEIAIDICENFEELMLPLKRRFFDAIKKEVQDKFRLDADVWSFFYQNDEHFCLFKYSWQIDKSDRGIYSFMLHNNEASGLVRNKKYDPKNLADEEQSIIKIVSNYKGMHIDMQNYEWWLLFKEPKPFTWGTQGYRKICNSESNSFKLLVEESVARMEDLLTLIETTELVKAIDECVEARKRNNKI